MKYTLLLFFLWMNQLSFSQTYFEDDLKSGLLIRGKIFGFVIIEDYWILNATSGLELRLTKNLSIGADFVHMNTIFEQEQYNDTTRPDYYDEYSQKNKRNCLLVDLRLYPLQNLFSAKPFKPYICAFSKIGGGNKFAQEEWRFNTDDVVRQNEDFYDIGITLGSHISLRNGRGGLDVNIGYCRRFLTENVEYYVEGGPNRMVYDQKIIQDRLAGRLNLYFYLFTKNREDY